MGNLYVVATPIGNLEDITFRAIKILQDVTLIAAEDTRVTRKLLTRYGLHTKLTSYHDHNKTEKLPIILDALKLGDVALVSDAGTPVISDPGLDLVAAAADNGITVVPIPGPSAPVAALSVSGLDPRQFLFLGFLPRRKADRLDLLNNVSTLPYTLIIFEAPHRFNQTLGDFLSTLGDRRISVIREATKAYEEIFRGSVRDGMLHFTKPRGEFTIVIAGMYKEKGMISSELVRLELDALLQAGLNGRDAREALSKHTGISRREAYDVWLKSKANPISE